MIRLEQVVKRYKTHTGMHTVLDHIDIEVHKGEKIGILGRNGAGKSTLIRIISGAELPNAGRVTRQMSVSWPLAFGGAFQGSLSGIDNVRFIFRVYGKDYRNAIPFIEDFSELGNYLREPVKSYSSGMAARLAFAISMAIEFDCFLIDEVIAVGDARFHEKCQRELFEKRGDRAMVIVSHDTSVIRQHCSRACVLSNGRLYEYEEMDAAYTQYNRLVKIQ